MRTQARIEIVPGTARPARRGGVSAGLFAAAIMAVIGMLQAATVGSGMLSPLRGAAALFQGTGALIGGPVSVLLGAATHFAVYGVLFGLLFSGLTGRSRPTLGWGLSFGFGLWLAMTFIALPLLNPVLRDRVALWPGTWLVLHLIYGACIAMAYAPPVRRTVKEIAVSPPPATRL
jgi:hypothetical protein